MERIATVLKWPQAGGRCLLCRTGAIEDAEHFLLQCPALLRHRLAFREVLQASLPYAGSAGRAYLDEFLLALDNDPARALALLAGAEFLLTCPVAELELVAEHAELVGKAAWLFDKICKNFLSRCWKARENLVGKITVTEGRLSHFPLEPRTLHDPSPPIVHFPASCRQDWMAWAPSCSLVNSRRASKRKNFYVVWQGRTCGIFYCWCDTFASVAAFPGAQFKGFETLADAEAAYEGGFSESD